MKHFTSFLVSALVFANVASALKLDVLIKGIPSQNGRIAYALFDKKEGFPNKAAYAQRSGYATLANSSEVLLQLQDLGPGAYALAIFQDMNENMKLDKNFLGVPTEPIAFSKNPP